MRPSVRVLCFAWVAAAVLSARPLEASAILNGSFEQPGFASWTVHKPSPGSLIFEGPGGHDGNYAAWFGSVSAADDTISQTVDITAGDTYQVDFWLSHDQTDHFNDFRVWWNGTLLVNLVNAASFGYTEFLVDVTVPNLTPGFPYSPFATLTFGGHDLLGYYRLDSVDVTQIPVATPEPATLVLFGLGTAALAGGRAWKRRRAKP